MYENKVLRFVTRVLVVDDHPSLRHEIVRLVESGHDLTVVGEAASGEDAIKKARRLQPDLILMDIVLPQMNGADAARIILEERPETLVVALSNYANRGMVRTVLEAGAQAYVRKDYAFEELLEAIDSVIGGHRFFGTGIEPGITAETQNNRDPN